MKFFALLVLVTSLFLLSGCEKENHNNVAGVAKSDQVAD